MQAAILRREELKAETERLRKARADAAAARLAETGGLSTAERITINVNAPSAIDQEGFSRAVTDALNNSYYRGTLGAAGLIAI
jgi:cell division GTPase FtsZ